MPGEVNPVRLKLVEVLVFVHDPGSVYPDGAAITRYCVLPMPPVAVKLTVVLLLPQASKTGEAVVMFMAGAETLFTTTSLKAVHPAALVIV